MNYNNYQMRQNNLSCGCNTNDSLDDVRRQRDFGCNFPIGMGYVPWQAWGDLFDLEKGFEAGTIFKELYKPFMEKGGCCI